jgi:hypothetical protein
MNSEFVLTVPPKNPAFFKSHNAGIQLEDLYDKGLDRCLRSTCMDFLPMETVINSDVDIIRRLSLLLLNTGLMGALGSTG